MYWGVNIITLAHNVKRLGTRLLLLKPHMSCSLGMKDCNNNNNYNDNCNETSCGVQ